MDGPDEAASAQADEDFQRELAARRKDLEREFADKHRELKAQHQRRMDALRQEQADWEEHKRARTKELADRTEALRRAEERLQVDTRKTVTAKDEAGALRKRVEALEAERAAERAAHATVEQRVADARAVARKARRTARWFALVSILGPLAWLVAGGTRAGTMATALSVAVVAVAIALALWRLDLKD